MCAAKSFSCKSSMRCATPPAQVEGIVGTYIANRQVPGNDFGATVISFDKGGEWSLVTPPASDYNNRPIHCVPVSQSLPYQLLAYCIIVPLPSPPLPSPPLPCSPSVPYTCTWRVIAALATSPSSPRTLPSGSSWPWVSRALLYTLMYTHHSLNDSG